jgi:GNAT superfamily N-acetyltransferase
MTGNLYDFLPEGFHLYHSNNSDPDIFKITAQQGYIYGAYRNAHRIYSIADFEVERRYRRQGIGRQLATAALQHAKSLEADVLMAAIVSRECLEVMEQVFGPEHIQVAARGLYDLDEGVFDDSQRASALLWYDMR